LIRDPGTVWIPACAGMTIADIFNCRVNNMVLVQTQKDAPLILTMGSRRDLNEYAMGCSGRSGVCTLLFIKSGIYI